MSARPLVGITTSVEPVRWGVWDRRAAVLPASYVEAVRRAGARVLLVPPDERPDEVLDVLDGLIVAGGADVGPERYGASPHAAADVPRTERDAAEIALVSGARERDLPLLGICRGMQVMAVEAGGSLVQHLPDVVGHERHRPAPATYGRHVATFAAGSRVAEILGVAREVDCYHHQAVEDPGHLTVTGWALDGTVEAVEEPGRRLALGVQWHPERDHDDPRLFDALVAAARGT